MNKKIIIYEMFMRDGLQSLSKFYSLTEKIYFLSQLICSNIKNIEFGSTTDPKILPQMSDSYELFDYIKKYIPEKNINFTMLVTNNYHLEKCIQNKIQSFGLLSSLCDEFGKINLNKTSLQSLDYMLNQMNTIVKKSNIDVNKYHIRLYISCAFGSDYFPYDMDRLLFFLLSIKKYITDEKIDYKNLDIVLCDTYGLLKPHLLDYILKTFIIPANLELYVALHLHIKPNENFYDLIDIALNNNIFKFDSCILNIGHCPFSKKVELQNINTLSLINYLHQKEYETNIEPNILKTIIRKISEVY